MERTTIIDKSVKKNLADFPLLLFFKFVKGATRDERRWVVCCLKLHVYYNYKNPSIQLFID